MQAIIKFLADLEVVIYLILGTVAVIYLRRLLLAIDERRTAIFGWEREAAQRKVNAAVTVLILIGLLTVAEFVVATFLTVEMRQEPTFATPTISVLSTPTETLSPEMIPTDATPTYTPYPQANIEGVPSDCVSEVLEITNPLQGDLVGGVVEILGSVNTPNFGSYKYEYSTMGEPNWITIAAGSEPGVNKNLGFWYTESLVPGDYMLRLVALDNNGVEQSACVLQVKVEQE